MTRHVSQTRVRTATPRSLHLAQLPQTQRRMPPRMRTSTNWPSLGRYRLRWRLCCAHAWAYAREYVSTWLCACACVRPCRPYLHVILHPWHNAAGGGVGGSSTNRNEGHGVECRSLRTADAAGLWRPINGKQAAWFLGRCCCRRRSGWGEGGRAESWRRSGNPSDQRAQRHFSGPRLANAYVCAGVGGKREIVRV